MLGVFIPISNVLRYPANRGDFGRLGHGDTNDVFLPMPISTFSGVQIKEVACGDTHTLVVTAQGDLYSFGRNQNGQLGLGHTDDTFTPTMVDAFKVRHSVMYH